jgi:hypothetical protein
MAQNAHLGKTHDVQFEKIWDVVISGVKFTKVCFKGKFTTKFQSTAENVPQLFNGIRDRRKTHQQTTYRKPMPWKRLVTSEFVCSTT